MFCHFEDVLNSAKHMQKSTNTDHLNENFRNFLARFDSLVHAVALIHKTRTTECYLIDTTYPERWMHHYIANSYQNIDPVIATARHKFMPYDWTEINIRNTSQMKMMQEFQKIGFKSGYAVPLHISPSMLLLFAMASHKKEINFHDRTILQISINQYHARYLQLNTTDSFKEELSLSDKERECLLWIARGKNTTEIGYILNMSENTVKYHLKNIMQKLGSHNRTQAVVQAINLGLIHP